MPDVRSPVDTKILEQMPFLRACIKETLRYYQCTFPTPSLSLSHSFHDIWFFVSKISKISHSFADCIPLLLVMAEIYNQMRSSMVFMFPKGYVCSMFSAHYILTFACFFFLTVIHSIFFISSNHLQTHVIFPHLAVSNSAEYFPEPQRFMPERWIKRGELSMHNAHCTFEIS